jgi:hypothetical protein
MMLKHLHEKLVERVLMGGAKISERMIVDRLHAGEPLVGRIVLTEAGDLSCGACALTVGIDPDAHEQPRIEGRGSRSSFD